MSVPLKGTEKKLFFLLFSLPPASCPQTQGLCWEHTWHASGHLWAPPGVAITPGSPEPPSLRKAG